MATVNFPGGKGKSGQSEFKLDSRSLNKLNVERVQELRKFIVPVTLPYTDVEGRILQLWKFKDNLIGTVSCDEGIVYIPSHNIVNPLQSDQNSGQLLNCLEERGLVGWQFSYSAKTRKIVIWPFMAASGREGSANWTPPTFSNDNSAVGHIFKTDKGHFPKDTPENRAFISQAVSNPSNRVGRDSFGNEYYTKTMPDGSQAWARVRNGVITNGGRNERPKKWVQGHPKHGGQLKDFYAATSFSVRSGRSPAERGFRQLLQQTHLT